MKSLVRAYTAFQVFHSLLLWLPIFYEFQKRIGLDDPQIFGIQSIYYAAFCFLEIPTGYAADRFGYRHCLKAGSVVLVFANLLPVWAPSYGGFLAHFLLIGLARSLVSGASSAYLYDAFKERGQEHGFKQVEGTARAYGLVAKVIGWAGIGYLMEWNFSSPYWLTACAAVVSGLYAWRLPALAMESSPGSHAGRRAPLQLRSMGQMLLSSPFLILVIIQGVAIFVLSRICQVNLFQPILTQKGFDLSALGILMSVMTLFEAIGSARPRWVLRRMNELQAVFLLTVVLAASLSAMAFTGKLGTVVALSILSLAAGFSFPIQRQLLNDAIPDSRYRATLLSVESIVDRAVCACVAVALGGFLSRGQLNLFLHLSAGVSLVTMLILMVALMLRWIDGKKRG